MIFLLLFLFFPFHSSFFLLNTQRKNILPLNLNKWYVIAQSNEIKPNRPYNIKILNREIVIWKNNNSFTALNNYCVHRGASLSNGIIINNTIHCPYHNIGFNKKGKITSMPSNFNPTFFPNICQKKYLIYEKHNWVYLLLNKTNSEDHNLIMEDEYYNKKNKCQFFSQIIPQNYQFVCENLLDILHISYVHSFGNKKNPLPVKQFSPKKMNKKSFHQKMKYYYITGSQSLITYLNEKNLVKVESEFIIPNKIVSRVKFGKYVKTIVSSALPIDNKTTKLFVKIYRNYWVFNAVILDWLADLFMEIMFRKTINEDSKILLSINTNIPNNLHLSCDQFPLTYRRILKKNKDKL